MIELLAAATLIASAHASPRRECIHINLAGHAAGVDMWKDRLGDELVLKIYREFGYIVLTPPVGAPEDRPFQLSICGHKVGHHTGTDGHPDCFKGRGMTLKTGMVCETPIPSTGLQLAALLPPTSHQDPVKRTLALVEYVKSSVFCTL